MNVTNVHSLHVMEGLTFNVSVRFTMLCVTGKTWDTEQNHIVSYLRISDLENF